MTETNKIRSIVLDDLKMVLIGIAVAAGIVAVFFGCLFLAFAFMLVGPDVTTAEVLSPNNVYVASIDQNGGGAVSPNLHKIYIQSKGKTIFDPRILVGGLVSAESSDHQSGPTLSWLSPNDLQISYLRARASNLRSDIVVNGRNIRIHQNTGSNRSRAFLQCSTMTVIG